MNRTFALFRAPGPAWVAGKTSREQPFWTDHALFMDKIFADGAVIMAGPYADYSGVLLLINAPSEEAVHELFSHDPFTTEEIHCTTGIYEWLIFMDSRHKQ